MSEQHILALPRIDVHGVAIQGNPQQVWSALGVVIARGWRVPPLAARLLRAEPSVRSGNPLVAGSTLPGFVVARADPGRELALEGHHRFSTYALIFHIRPLDGAIQLEAETRAVFPGLSGNLYRGLVIGTRGHVVIVRSLLSAVRRRVERR